jgi:PAS domain S-box-containing protein
VIELEKERAWLQATLENIPAGLLLAEAPTGRIVMGNAEMEKIVRHPVLSSPDVDSYVEWVGYHPDGRRVQGREWPLARALEGETIRNEPFLYMRGDGTMGWVEASAAPVYDRQRHILGAVVAVNDIDSSRRAAEETRNSERRFRAIFEQAYSFFVLLSKEGVVVDANSAALRVSGFSRNALLGHLLWENDWWRGADDQERLKMAVQETIRGRPFQGEMRFVTAGGIARVVDLSLTPIRGDSGELAFILASGVNVTERKQAEELARAWEQQKLAARIAHSLAHEINNPLEILTNCLFLLQDRTNAQSNYSYLSAAQEALGRLTAISGELIAIFSGKKLDHEYTDEILGRTSELDLLLGILENLGDTIIACDRDGVVKFLNRAARQLYGIPQLPQSLRGCSTAFGVFYPDGKTLLPDDELPLYRALRGEQVKNASLVLRPPGSGKAWRVEAAGAAIPGDDKPPIGAFVACKIQEEIP